MSLTYQRELAPLTAARIDQVLALAQRVFDEPVDGGAHWRFEQMPDVSLCTAWDADQVVGFKIGYGHTPRRYYSWLGGVDPAYRRRGIGQRLMQLQHEWLRETAYERVETGTQQDNSAMCALNLANDFQIVGMRSKARGVEVTFEKKLRA